MSMIFRKAAGANSTTLLRSLLAAPTTSSAAAAAFSRPMSVSAMIQAGRGGFQSYGSREPSAPSKTLFVGGLSWDTTSDELREAFERNYGESVASSKLIWDRMQDRSKGSVDLSPRSLPAASSWLRLDYKLMVSSIFCLRVRFGYVEFIDEATATQAKEDMNEALLGGRRIRLDYANADPAAGGAGRSGGRRGDRPPSPPSPTLYFGNLPNAMSTSELSEILTEELVSEAAPIDVRMPMGRDGGIGDAQNKGFAYVQFQSTEEATAALTKLQPKAESGEFTLEGRDPRIDYETPRKEFSADGGRGGRGGFGGAREGRGGSYGGRRDSERFDRARSDRGGRSDRYGGGGGRRGSDYDL